MYGGREGGSVFGGVGVFHSEKEVGGEWIG